MNTRLYEILTTNKQRPNLLISTTSPTLVHRLLLTCFSIANQFRIKITHRSFAVPRSIFERNFVSSLGFHQIPQFHDHVTSTLSSFCWHHFVFIVTHLIIHTSPVFLLEVQTYSCYISFPLQTVLCIQSWLWTLRSSVDCIACVMNICWLIASFNALSTMLRSAVLTP